jgi:Na+-translocating ferredoxin:NAD+ oxidoreductase RNF subunit RnfB
MSNYYISNCCKAPANIVAMLGKAGAFQCTKCFKECQVTAMLDTPGGVPKEEAHETMHGWCCACEADIAELNHRLEVQKAEMLSTIKGLGCNPENDSLTIARILNELR